jgi:hypothetical protein
MVWRRSTAIESLEEHPNLGEILGVLSQLPHISDGDLPKLADAWHNTVFLADARAHALTPDSPLVLEVLAAFEAVQSLFEDDLNAELDYVTIDPGVTSIALKAVRDAIAAAYARPVLTRAEHAALLKAWHAVYPEQRVEEPDLGPRAAEVKAVLAVLPLLATRCHDAEAAGLFETLATRSWVIDDDMRQVARGEAWQAAVLTSRRRVWGLVRRSGTEGISRFCNTCGGVPSGEDETRVLELCLDAACALLVADAVDDNLTDVLVLPLRELIPTPRRPAD